MTAAWYAAARGALPIGSVCIYPGPVSTVSSAANPAWRACDASRSTRDASALAAEPDSAPALLEAQGWMVCDGRALQVSAFPRLYAVLGTLYGGSDGIFHLPDLRGVFLRGVDHGAGVDPDVGQRRGPDGSGSYDGVGSMQCDALQTHVHSYDGVSGSAVAQQGSPAFSAQQPKDTTAPKNARVSSETRPKNVAVWFIIRYA